jgi:hypothetical protein
MGGKVRNTFRGEKRQPKGTCSHFIESVQGAHRTQQLDARGGWIDWNRVCAWSYVARGEAEEEEEAAGIT